MVPFGYWKLDKSVANDRLRELLDARLSDKTIWSWHFKPDPGIDLKGGWHGLRLFFIGARENIVLAGAVHWLILPARPDAKAKVFSLGNVVLVLLFLILCLQILFLLWRVVKGTWLGGEPVAEMLSLSTPVRSPLIHILSTSTFYLMLYINLYRKSVARWKSFFRGLPA